jgi:DNA modification methylase
VTLDTGVLYRNDNVERLEALQSQSVDLIYLDPPFFSNRIYEVIWGDEAEVRSFKDRWAGGLVHYVDWMKQRVVQLHRVLKRTGTLYLHCDPHASHYLRVMVDEDFGSPERLLNEVIWRRTAAKGDARRKFGAVHDVILVYTKASGHYFAPQFTEQTETYLGRFTLDDHDGRGPYRLAPLDSPNPRPNLTYEYKGHAPPKKGWRVNRELMEQLDTEGRLAFPRKSGGRIARKHYLREQDGPKATDVWTDVAPIQAVSAQREGWPTQKPEALLTRIIAASSREGDVVLDPFCGCGTTVAVAHRMNRQWVGIDISPTAITIMERRLWNQSRFRPEVVDMPDTEDALKRLDPFEFQNWIINAVYGSHSPRLTGDMGIDGYWWFTKEPIQVKQQEHVGRETVDKFETAIRREGHDSGYIIAFSFTRPAYTEVARAKADGLSIRLLLVKEVLISVQRDRKPRNMGPLPEGDVLPLPEKRKPEALPTAADLVESASRAAG